MTDHIFAPDLCIPHISPEVTKGPDAALIRLCRVSVEMEADYRDMCNMTDGAAAMKLIEEQRPMRRETRAAIQRTKARTLAGVKAKAAAYYAFWQPDPPQDHELGWSVILDLLDTEMAP